MNVRKGKILSKIRGKIRGKKREIAIDNLPMCSLGTLQVARIKNRSKSDALQFEEYKVEEQAVATS